MDHHKLIQEEFRKQANRFGERTLTLARQDYLRWMVDQLELRPDLTVLDVAAGTGHLSRALAPHVHQVVALDATLEMLLQGREEAKRAGLQNIMVLQGFAESLPFPAHSFDLLTCRFAIHHFENPSMQIQEMVRVCRLPGRVAIIDLVAPEDPGLAREYNYLERLRDPSHTWALSRMQLQQIMEEAGLQITITESRDIEVQLEPWLDLTKTPPLTRDAIQERLSQEINHSAQATGMRPFFRGEELLFRQTWSIVVGVKREYH